MHKFLSFFLIFNLIFSGCASRRNQANIQNNPLSTIEQEKALGEKIHQEIMATFYLYTDPDVVNYVGRIGKSIAKNARRQEIPYQFMVLYNEKIYATSAPGGYVYITTGMLSFLENESELAAALAHEIGRLQYADIRLTATNKVVDVLTHGTAIVAPVFGAIGALAMLGVALLNVGFQATGLTKENHMLKGDEQALNLMVASGYDPQGMLDFLYKFLEAEKNMAPYFYDYYQSRPITEERFNELKKEFSELELGDKSFNTNHQVYLDMTKGVREIYRMS